MDSRVLVPAGTAGSGESVKATLLMCTYEAEASVASAGFRAGHVSNQEAAAQVPPGP